jgi:hypothetical protein
VAGTGPHRRVTDHWHVEYQTHEAQIRYEQRIEKQLEEIRDELQVLANRMLLMMGGLGLVAFLLPIIAPFLRDLLGVEVPPSQTP